MKGMMAFLLVIVCATGMVVGQQTNNSNVQNDGPPLLYDLPVTDSLLDGIKREGWRQATLEPEVRGRVYQILFRNPFSNSTLEPDIIYNSNGIRDRALYFVVNDQQLETMRTRGLKYQVKPDEIKQFDSIVLVYESPYPTVPMSPEIARQQQTQYAGAGANSSGSATNNGSNQADFRPPAGNSGRRSDSTMFAGGSSTNNGFPSNGNPPSGTGSSNSMPASRPSTDWQTQPATGSYGSANTGNSYLDNLPERNSGSMAANNGFRPRVQDNTGGFDTGTAGSRNPTLLEMQQANQDYQNRLAQDEARRQDLIRREELLQLERQNAARAQELREREARLQQQWELMQREQLASANQTASPDDFRSTLNHPTYQYPPRYGDSSFDVTPTGRQDVVTGPPPRTSLAPIGNNGWNQNRVADASGSVGMTSGTTTGTISPLVQLLAQNGLDDEQKLSATLEQHAQLLAEVERMRQIQKTNGFLWFMLLFTIGLCVYLSWIARGFYVRYAELADELRETFTSTLS